MKKLLILLFIPLHALQGQNLWFVSPDGNDSGDGSNSYPWATLSHAFSQSSPGDEVCMMPGTYNISQQLIWPSGVTLRGLGETGSGSVRIESNYSASGQPLMKGETYRGWLYPNTAGHQSMSNIVFDGNGITWIAIEVNFRHNVRIFNCRFENFYHRGLYFMDRNQRNLGEPILMIPQRECQMPGALEINAITALLLIVQEIQARILTTDMEILI